MTVPLWIIPALPLAGFVVNGLLGRRLSRRAVGGVACGSVGLAFLVALGAVRGLVLLSPEARVIRQTVYSWIGAGDFQVSVGLLLDPLSALMVLVVTGVGFLIHIYSVGYMHEDPDYSRYFAQLNLFVFFMLLLVLADNYLLLFVGWEGVGCASYMLIGFWFEREAAARAGLKAFIVNRVGDAGFLIALFLPRQLASRGDRLVFSNGILILGVLSAVLVVAFRAETHMLIPLYAVGVFLSFTLSQAGMVRRWWRRAGRGWFGHIVVNGLGAAATAVVLGVVVTTKFVQGAWAVILLLPAFVAWFVAVRLHYRRVAIQLSIEGARRPTLGHVPVVVLVGRLHRGVLKALAFAKAISTDVTAVTVDIDPTETSRLRMRWPEWFPDVPLIVLESPYRSVVGPLLEYIDRLDRDKSGPYLIVVLPEFVPARWWHHLLHNQTALLIKAALLFHPGKITVSVPYHLQE